jgi:uncharacterized protein
METFLLILAILCLLGGLAGAVLPLPGPPLSYAGLLLLHYSGYASLSKSVLVGFLIATLASVVADYYASIWGTKKLGGTSWGSWGSMIGLLIGLFVIPGIGLFLGAFLGAFVGELAGGADSTKAFKAAIGSFLGLVAGIVMKVILCLLMIVYATWAFF